MNAELPEAIVQKGIAGVINVNADGLGRNPARNVACRGGRAHDAWYLS
jgi:hypothetical protein